MHVRGSKETKEEFYISLSHNFCHLSDCSDDDDDVCLQKEGNESPQTEKRAEQRASAGQSDDEDKENEPDDEDDEEDDDDGGGWITPGNIKEVKMDSADWTAPADIKVGCLTTDFAMQVTDADGAFAVVV